MKKLSLKFVFIIATLFFVGGYMWGKYQNKLLTIFSYSAKQQIPKNIFQKLDNKLFNFTNKKEILPDNLLNKNKTIIFFWSPTCNYCKELYQKIDIDTNNVGEIWIPQTNDFEYLEYFLSKNNINKIQLVKSNQDYFTIVDTFDIQNIPELWIVDKKGNIIYQHTGSKITKEFYDLCK